MISLKCCGQSLLQNYFKVFQTGKNMDITSSRCREISFENIHPEPDLNYKLIAPIKQWTNHYHHQVCKWYLPYSVIFSEIQVYSTHAFFYGSHLDPLNTFDWQSIVTSLCIWGKKQKKKTEKESCCFFHGIVCRAQKMLHGHKTNNCLQHWFFQSFCQM